MSPSSPLRLFVDAHCFDQEYQGSRRFIQGLYNELAHYNDLEIYLAAYDTGNLQKYFPKRGNLHFIPYKSKSKYFRLAYDIPRLIKKHRSQVAHFQYITPLIKNCRQVVTIHDLLFKEYPEEFPASYKIIKNYFFRRAAKTSDLVTTVSDFSKKSIRQFYQPAAEVAIIPNGINTSGFKTQDHQQASRNILSRYGIGKYILCVSRIEPRKNHLALLKAFLDLELYKKDYYLVLAGYASIRVKALEILVKNIPVEAKKKLHVFEQLGEDELLQFYQGAEVFVYPSRAEGFGLPPLEAAAMQVPVICSNAAAMKDYDFFGQNHIDPANHLSLAERLSFLINNRPANDELELIAGKITSRYCWKQSARKFHDLLIQQSKIPAR